jgi:hypothetical protein
VQTWLQKKEKKKRKKRKRKDDRMLIRSDLTYLNLIFCGPEWTEEKIAITREIWTHQSTLVHAMFTSNYESMPKSRGSPWDQKIHHGERTTRSGEVQLR